MKRTAGDILKEKGGEIISVDADAKVVDALAVMAKHNVGAVVVTRDGGQVGIWTERDLRVQILQKDFDHRTASMSDYMNPHLIIADADEQVYQLYDRFLGQRIRHVMVKDGEDIIGVLSVVDVVRASLQQKMLEFEELNEIISLEYYENWKIRQNERF